MKRYVAVVLLLLGLVGGLLGQSPPDLTMPDNLLDKEVLIVLGPSFITGGGQPAVGGTIGASIPLSQGTTGGVFADIGFRRSGNPQIVLRGQIAQHLFDLTIGGRSFPVVALADVGPTFAASDPSVALHSIGQVFRAVVQNVGTNVGYLAATGLGTDVLVRDGLHVSPFARLTKGSLNSVGWCIGFNVGFKVSLRKVKAPIP